MRWALVLLVACECSEQAEPEPPAATEDPADELVLTWEVSHPRWGTELLMVKGDGRARYLLVDVHQQLRTEMTLADGTFRALRDDLAHADTCALSSGREGREDESRPKLSLRFPEQRCDIELWYEEWRTTEVHGILEDLRERLKAAPAAQPPTETPP